MKVTVFNGSPAAGRSATHVMADAFFARRCACWRGSERGISCGEDDPSVSGVFCLLVSNTGTMYFTG